MKITCFFLFVFTIMPGPLWADLGMPLPNLPGHWSKRNFANSAGDRDFFIYYPEKHSQKLPLLLMLHGCVQDAESFALSTRMNQLAEKYGFMVIYPEQRLKDNDLRCWNWFDPVNQVRGQGEPSIFVDMIRFLETKLPIDQKHIFVAGLSAGAATAANIIALYPDIFSGAAIHSGLEFEAARSVAEAFEVQKKGATQDLKQSAMRAFKENPRPQFLPAVVVLHGTEDKTVNPINFTRTLKQMSFLHDLQDDGLLNESQSARPLTSQKLEIQGGHKYTVETFGGTSGPHIDSVLVEGMGHAWSGGQGASFADPAGPDASEMIWQFLWTYSNKSR